LATLPVSVITENAKNVKAAKSTIGPLNLNSDNNSRAEIKTGAAKKTNLSKKRPERNDVPSGYISLRIRSALLYCIQQ
jgi:hypothetical protein